jgi:hypothetical protein
MKNCLVYNIITLESCFVNALIKFNNHAYEETTIMVKIKTVGTRRLDLKTLEFFILIKTQPLCWPTEKYFLSSC